MTLYTYFRSSAAYRVRIALNLKGLDYEPVPVHLVRDGGQHRRPEYLELNPAGLVPALEDAGQVLTQSLAIIEYLDETHPQQPLLPADAGLQNYRELFMKAGMGRFLFNSFLISSAVMLLSVLFNTLAGYAFAKLQFKGRDRTFRALLAALVIPGQVAMMPLFLLLKQMGLVNTYLGAIVPGMLARGGGRGFLQYFF